jgi:uncharacterized YkwD family protein
LKRITILLVAALLMASVAVQASAWQWWNQSPTVPTQPTVPSQPTQPSQPSQPSYYWWQPNLPSQPSQPTWPTQPSEPTVPTQPTQPSEPIDPVQPGQPSTPVDPVGNKVPFPSLSLSSDEQRLIDLVNQERAKAGLSPLQVDMDLVRVAKVKSHDMAEHNYFSHVSPTYGTVYNMLDQEGVFYTRAGENIARASSVNRAHELFMNSSGHRANILHSGYTHIGVGIVKYGTSYRVTQVFIKR